MIYHGENWGLNDYIHNGEILNSKVLPTVQEGDVFISCNLSRSKPYTKIFNDVADLTFLNCNLNGVDIKNTWVIDENCSYNQNEYDYTEIILPGWAQ
jgi:hypothetical protein